MDIQNEFDIVRPLLRPTDQLASTYPHPTAYEPYNVVYYKEDDIFGMHPDDMCDRIQLAKQDVIKYEFDLRKFREILSKILGFHGSQEDFPYNTRVIPLGFWEETGGQTYPVLLVMPTHTKSFAEIMFQFFATKTSPMIIITPTNRFWAKEAIELFLQRKSIVVSLQEIIEVNDNVWMATDEWKKTLQNFRDLLRPPHLIEVPLYEFRKKGEIWHVRFGGQEGFLKDSVGAKTLSILLSKPGESILAVDLYLLGTGIDPQTIPQPSGGVELSDQQSILEIEQKAKMLIAELDSAQNQGDTVLENEIREEIDQLSDYLCQVKGLGGRLRKGNDNADSIRRSVQQGIKRVFESLDDDLPDFVKHCRQSISFGFVLRYDSVTNIQWEL
jgi:hypothetical protein